MKKLLLTILLISCISKDPGPLPTIDLTIKETQEKIDANRIEIERLEKEAKERQEKNDYANDYRLRKLEERAYAIRVMIDCVNKALDDKSMCDRDQVLTIETCMQTAEYR